MLMNFDVVDYDDRDFDAMDFDAMDFDVMNLMLVILMLLICHFTYLHASQFQFIGFSTAIAPYIITSCTHAGQATPAQLAETKYVYT